MSDLRTLLEGKMEKEYERWLSHMADRKTPGNEYDYRCGYLKAIADVGQWIKEIVQKTNDTKFKEEK